MKCKTFISYMDNSDKILRNGNGHFCSNFCRYSLLNFEFDLFKELRIEIVLLRKL